MFSAKTNACDNPERFQVGTVNGEPYAFVDQNGVPFIMKGINVRRCINSDRSVRYSQSEFNQISTRGFNTIRLPLNWKDFETSAGNFSSTAFNSLDIVIQRAENAGLQVILDPIHVKGDTYWNIPSWAWGNMSPDGNKVFAELEDHALPYLQQMTARYCNNPTVIAIDLINEPREAQTVNGLDNRNALLISLYTNLISNLRQIDPNKPFMVEPFYGSARISTTRLLPLNQFDNIIWSSHDYYAGEGSPSDGFSGSGYTNVSPRTESWQGSGSYPLSDRNLAKSHMAQHVNVHRNAALNAGLGFHIGEFGIPQGWSGKSDFLCDKLSVYSELNVPTTAWVWNKDIDGGFGIWLPDSGWVSWSDSFTNPDCFNEVTPVTCDNIKNGNFDAGSNNWTDYTHSSTIVSWNANNAYADFTISNGGDQNWRVQLIQNNVNIEQGVTYELRFRAKADASKAIYCKLSNEVDNVEYAYEDFTISTVWQTYTFTFTMNNATDLSSRLNFGVGQNNIDIAFDDIELERTDCDLCDDELIGTPCDDADACTIADTYDNDCNCVGIFLDSDMDTVCDAEDVCPNFDDTLMGQPCDDNNPNTTNDVYGTDCICTGTPIPMGENICSASNAIIIDGLGSEWSQTIYDITNILLDTINSQSDLSATFQIQWDNDFLYVLGNIQDANLINDSADAYQDDSFEVYIDGGNEKANSYDQNDFQLTFRYDDSNVYWLNGILNPAGVDFAQTTNGSAYSMEIRIAWSFIGVNPEVGNPIGIDIHVNDDDNGGNRDKKISWYATIDEAWNNPSVFNTMTLQNCECSDSDDDGVCDADDICPNFDDSLIGQPCDDNNPDTINDVFGSNCLCAGTTNTDDCPPTLSLSGNITNSLYQAQQNIESDGNIQIGINVEFKAGICILLKPDFETAMQSEFSAVIEECGNNQ